MLLPRSVAPPAVISPNLVVRGGPSPRGAVGLGAGALLDLLLRKRKLR